MNQNSMPLAALALIFAASACGSEAAPATPEPAPAANPPAASAAPALGAPPVHAAPAAAAAGATDGVVQETMDAASYTYMRVETNSGSVWVAAMSMPVSVGDHVTFQGSEMQGFHSSTLDRTFDRIVFANSASIVGAEAAGGAPGNGPAPLAPGQTELPPGHPPLGDAPAAPAAADPLAH